MAFFQDYCYYIITRFQQFANQVRTQKAIGTGYNSSLHFFFALSVTKAHFLFRKKFRGILTINATRLDFQ